MHFNTVKTRRLGIFCRFFEAIDNARQLIVAQLARNDIRLLPLGG